MDRINAPAGGDRIRAKWASDIVDQIRRLNIIPGNGIRKTVTSKGVRIDVDVPADQTGGGDSAVMSDVVPCIVDGGGALEGYQVTLYPQGFDHRPSTRSGTLYIPELSTNTNIPFGTSILAHICPATFMQSDEEEDEDELNPSAQEGN